MSVAGPKPGVAPKPLSIDIKIDGHYNSKVYTSGSTINGHAVIQPPRDVSFDAFDITFTGTTFTRLDFVQQFPTHSFRPFMKLRMPLSDSDLPASRTFEAGRRYIVPFNFVVPHNLTIGACTHNTASPAVRDHHLRLPPTMGFWEADDLAPDMAHVEYAIKARAFKKLNPSAKPMKLVEGVHNLKVLPALLEDAPLDITAKDERYTMSKSKTIRKGLLSAKTGKLTVSSAQPSAVMLSADGHGASTSMARINVEFAPSSVDSVPPRINSVTSKLQALTFFSAVAADSLPNLGNRTAYTTNHSLSYSTTQSLPTTPVNKVAWVKEAVAGPRRDSGYSSSCMDENMASDSDNADARPRRGSKAKNSKIPRAPPIKHTTSLEVPITVKQSNKKIFLPTFHSCLASRTYILQLSLSVGPTNTAMNLFVPIQLGVEQVYEPQGSELPSFESVMAQVEQEQANLYLRPRAVQAPAADMQRSMLPGYDELHQRSISVI